VQQLACASAEKARRDEAKTAATAEARDADAIKRLAKSIRDSADQAMLNRIMAGLNERTRYAVKAQLKGKFGLSREFSLKFRKRIFRQRPWLSYSPSRQFSCLPFPFWSIEL
jgi:hypothetical protein